MKQFKLLIRLLCGMAGGMLIGLAGGWFGIAQSSAYQMLIRLFVTFTSLFSTFLSFCIPLLIVSFVAVGLADLGKKANKLFGVTLALAYGTTVLSGFV